MVFYLLMSHTLKISCLTSCLSPFFCFQLEKNQTDINRQLHHVKDEKEKAEREVEKLKKELETKNNEVHLININLPYLSDLKKYLHSTHSLCIFSTS